MRQLQGSVKQHAVAAWIAATMLLMTSTGKAGDKKPESVSREVLLQGSTPMYPCEKGDVADCLRRCEQNHARSCDAVGEMYKRGIKLKRDPKKGEVFVAKARGLYAMACTIGHPRSCGIVGGMLVRGVGGPKDYRKALDICQRSCDQADGLSCMIVASIYASGLGAPVDQKKAVTFTRKSCATGYDVACATLKTMRAKEGLVR